MNITLGSTSPHKLNALQLACEKLGLQAIISGIKASSEQNEQPVGFDETYAGALTRATFAQAHKPDDIAVGIESGIFHFGTTTPKTLDIAVIVVLTGSGQQIVTTSAGVLYPEECVNEARVRGFESTTVGSVITELFGGDPTDPHSVLTKNRVTRTATLVDALVTALKQL